MSFPDDSDANLPGVNGYRLWLKNNPDSTRSMSAERYEYLFATFGPDLNSKNEGDKYNNRNSISAVGVDRSVNGHHQSHESDDPHSMSAFVHEADSRADTDERSNKVWGEYDNPNSISAFIHEAASGGVDPSVNGNHAWDETDDPNSFSAFRHQTVQEDTDFAEEDKTHKI